MANPKYKKNFARLMKCPGRQEDRNRHLERPRSNPHLARLGAFLVLSSFWAGVLPGQAQPTIVSTVPPNMATGVSPTAPLVILFSQPMNPGQTAAQFIDFSSFPPVFLPASPAWSSGNAVLTCTPVPAWPANTMLVWIVEGENPAGDALEGETSGTFTTGGAPGGNCTNEVGSLTLGKGVYYRQTSAGPPALDTNAPFIFVACAALACSNLATTNISLTVPGGRVTNLFATLPPDYYSLNDIAGSQAALESRYPNGNYLFTLRSGAGSWPCTVNFPASLLMPNAPRLTNFAAAQSVNPSQPFVLAWDAFQGAGGNSCIHVEIYGDVFQTPSLGLPGALPGSARSVTIPADTLQPNRTYEGAITFYDYTLNTNSCGYVTLVYRSAATEFTLVSAGDAPFLAIARTATNTVVLSWPLPGTGWRLQTSASLSPTPGAWTEIPPPYQANATHLYRVEPAASGTRFYRLYKP